MGLKVAENPTAAMKIHHDRQCTSCIPGTDSPRAHGSRRTDRKCRVVNAGRWLADWDRLGPRQHYASLCRREGMDRRQAGLRVDELLGDRLKHRIRSDAVEACVI